jgi:hypothetical protein
MDDFLGACQLVKGTKPQFTGAAEAALIGCRRTDLGFTGLMPAGAPPPA